MTTSRPWLGISTQPWLIKSDTPHQRRGTQFPHPTAAPRQRRMISNSRAISGRTSFEPRHGKGPTGRHIDIKPGHTQPAGGSGASPPGPLNATNNVVALPQNN